MAKIYSSFQRLRILVTSTKDIRLKPFLLSFVLGILSTLSMKSSALGCEVAQEHSEPSEQTVTFQNNLFEFEYPENYSLIQIRQGFLLTSPEGKREYECLIQTRSLTSLPTGIEFLFLDEQTLNSSLNSRFTTWSGRENYGEVEVLYYISSAEHGQQFHSIIPLDNSYLRISSYVGQDNEVLMPDVYTTAVAGVILSITDD